MLKITLFKNILEFNNKSKESILNNKNVKHSVQDTVIPVIHGDLIHKDITNWNG